MHSFIIFLFFYLGVLPLLAQQPYFETRIPLLDSGEQANNIFPTTQGYLLTGASILDTQAIRRWNGLLIEIDPLGKVLRDTMYVDETIHMAFYDALTLPNQEYAITSIYIPPDIEESRGHFMKIDADWNILTEQLIGSTQDGHWVGIYDLSPAVGGQGFIATGQRANRPHRDGGYLKVNIVKLDAEGHTEWDRLYEQYSGPDGYAGLGQIQVTPDGGYYAIGISSFREDHSHTLLLKLNQDGDVTWDKSYDFIGIEDVGASLLQTVDDHLIITGGHANVTTTNPLADTGFVLKTDRLGNVVWFTDSLSSRRVIIKAIQGQDEHIVVMGNTKRGNDLLGRIAKLDINTGAVLWSRTYGDSGDRYLRDMVATPDGGFLICGRILDRDSTGFRFDDVYLLKVNCMGLLTTPQASFDYAGNAQTLHLHNTSQFVYPGSIDGGHFLWDFGDGHTSTEVSPTHTYAEGGTYTVKLMGVVCTDTSIVEQTISVSVVGVEEQAATTVFPPYPNPAKEVVYIPYHLPQNSQLHLYNSAGELVQIKVVQAGQGTLSVATSNFPAGVYVYEWTRGGQQQKGGKFVVVQ